MSISLIALSTAASNSGSGMKYVGGGSSTFQIATSVPFTVPLSSIALAANECYFIEFTIVSRNAAVGDVGHQYYVANCSTADTTFTERIIAIGVSTSATTSARQVATGYLSGIQTTSTTLSLTITRRLGNATVTANEILNYFYKVFKYVPA